jgi:hypothetical protein
LSKFTEKLAEAAKNVWHEVGPFFKHGVAVACLVLVAALVIKLLEMFLPTGSARALDEIDLYLVKALFWLFGGYTFLIIGNRLLRFLISDVSNTWRKQPENKKLALGENTLNVLPRHSDQQNVNMEQLLAEITAVRLEVGKLQNEVRNKK